MKKRKRIALVLEHASSSRAYWPDPAGKRRSVIAFVSSFLLVIKGTVAKEVGLTPLQKRFRYIRETFSSELTQIYKLDETDSTLSRRLGTGYKQP